MKIAVYAIALNEEKHVERWLASVKDADHVVFCDTGSTDVTRRIFFEESHNPALIDSDCSFFGYDISIRPFRFDHARNAALALVPEDIDVCIALDMDEVLLPGWRAAIEENWKPDTTRLTYGFDLDKGRRMVGFRIHARHAYDWKYPCHEALIAKRGVQEKIAHCNTDLIAHKPDDSKPRRYLPMLIDAVKEFPDDARMAFYLGREHKFACQWQDAIKQMQRYLDLDPYFKEQRAEAMRYIGECLERLNEGEHQAASWYMRACIESPDERVNWLAFADHRRRERDWTGGLWGVQNALRCPEQPGVGTYDPYLLRVGPYDIGGVCAFYAGQKEQAALWMRTALELDPGNLRLRQNLSFVTPS